MEIGEYMVSGKKRILVLVSSILLVYALFAIIETVNLNSKTVDEAFIKFTESQSLKNKIVDKAVYTIDNIAFVPFKTGNQVSMVIFVKGWFGWEMKEYSRKLQSGGTDYSSDMDLYYGIIQKIWPQKHKL